MPLISWGATKYFPGGHGTFVGCINSFVHIIMYTYYFLSAFGPQMQKYLWWKKHITNLQMVRAPVIILVLSQWIGLELLLLYLLSSRSNSASSLYTRPSCCTPNATTHAGPCASRCQMPSSSSSSLKISTKNPTRRRMLWLQQRRWRRKKQRWMPNLVSTEPYRPKRRRFFKAMSTTGASSFSKS